MTEAEIESLRSLGEKVRQALADGHGPGIIGRQAWDEMWATYLQRIVAADWPRWQAGPLSKTESL